MLLDEPYGWNILWFVLQWDKFQVPPDALHNDEMTTYCVPWHSLVDLHGSYFEILVLEFGLFNVLLAARTQNTQNVANVTNSVWSVCKISARNKKEEKKKYVFATIRMVMWINSIRNHYATFDFFQSWMNKHSLYPLLDAVCSSAPERYANERTPCLWSNECAQSQRRCVFHSGMERNMLSTVMPLQWLHGLVYDRIPLTRSAHLAIAPALHLFNQHAFNT